MARRRTRGGQEPAIFRRAMPAIPTWTRNLLTPAPMGSRPRWLHWLAWLASIVSFVVLAVPLVTEREEALPATWRQLDLWICLGFTLEFFTRSGFRQGGWRYARWRGFDFLGMVPVVFLDGFVQLPAWLLWLVLVARLTRMVDRTLGDGFVKRNALALVEAVEEEISDRVVGKIMTRIEGELGAVRFGQATADVMAKHRDAVLHRIYEEQLPETSTLARIANFTGVQKAVERLEARVFDSVVGMIQSDETDALVREILTASFQRAREEITKRSWRKELGASPRPGQ